MCKYATDEMECIFENQRFTVGGFCFHRMMEFRLRTIASKIPIVKKVVATPRPCSDFIGIPRTDDSWYRELFPEVDGKKN